MAEFVLELDADWGWDGKYLVGLTLLDGGTWEVKID
jgi:hypothetical protein